MKLKNYKKFKKIHNEKSNCYVTFESHFLNVWKKITQQLKKKCKVESYQSQKLRTEVEEWEMQFIIINKIQKLYLYFHIF